MKKLGLVFLSFCGTGCLFMFLCIAWYVSTNNHVIDLENRFVAAQSNREMLYDNMAKQIREKLNIATMERDTVKTIVDAAVAGRNGGSVFRVVSEQYPELNEKLFQEVMATVSGKRDEFTRSQQIIAQIKVEHDNMRQRIPSKWIVGDREPLSYVIVSSDNTKTKMSNGVDDDLLIKSKNGD